MDREGIIALIEESTHHRGWISNSYAQVEFLLGDLIWRCRAFPEYSEQTKTISHSATKRVKKVRAMLEIEGPLTASAQKLGSVLDAFELNHDLRNLLAHGFCEFQPMPAGDPKFAFRKFERGKPELGEDDAQLVQRFFRIIDLRYHKEQLVAEASHAVLVFGELHHRLGWAGT